jgi:ergothioneine biosynthesis protein EgtB
MITTARPAALDRAALLERFVRIRQRTRAFFDLLDESAYYDRPIRLRNPVVFYEGHLPAFAVNTLIKKALGRPGLDEHLERIFARGIDPEAEAQAVARGNPAWPSRRTVLDYAAHADRLIADAIANADLDRPGHPLLDGAEALWTVLEHEEMHQETMAYMWHEVPYARKRAPAGYDTCPPAHRDVRLEDRQVRIPAGVVSLGTAPATSPFAWDNERPPCVQPVSAFDLDVDNVTNEAFMAFVDAGGYREPRWWQPSDWQWIRAEGITHPRFWEFDGSPGAGEWYWRGMFARVPLPAAWPVYVTWAEANAFATWSGRRLPSEAEYHRAAYGLRGGGERLTAWPGDLPEAPRGNFDFARWDPEPVGSYPHAASDFGVRDLVGNGWEWTSTVFAPFDGFAASPSYPEYSAEFFDGEHYVMKGASPLTAAPLVRRGFRNWFRPRYPFVYATFRRAAGDGARR